MVFRVENIYIENTDIKMIKEKDFDLFFKKYSRNIPDDLRSILKNINGGIINPNTIDIPIEHVQSTLAEFLLPLDEENDYSIGGYLRIHDEIPYPKIPFIIDPGDNIFLIDNNGVYFMDINGGFEGNNGNAVYKIIKLSDNLGDFLKKLW